MARKGTVLLLALALLTAVSSCDQQRGQSAEGNIALTLDSLERKLGWLECRLAQENWRELVVGRSDSLEFLQELFRSVVSDRQTLTILRDSRSQLDSEFDQRRHDILYPIVMRTYVDNCGATRPVYDSLADFHSRDWCYYDMTHLAPERVRNIVVHEDGRADRELAYRALNSPGESAVSQLGRLFRLRNQTASGLGYSDYLTLRASLTGERAEDYLHLLRQIDSVTESEYSHALGKFQSSFRPGIPELWDWEHDLRSTLDQASGYLPADSQLAFVKASLADLGFSLDDLPIYFDVDSEVSGPPWARAITIDAPRDVRVVAGLTDGPVSTSTLMRAVGVAVHTVETAQESLLLSRVSDPAWSAGVACFFESLCYDPEWLRVYARVPESQISRVTEAARTRELLSLRLLLVDAMFEYEAYRNPNRNLNSLYWDLFVKYTQLARHEDITPWAAKAAFASVPLQQRDLLLARLVAAQTASYLEEQYGRIIGNPEIGSFLVHNYFRFGNRYDWRELVERGTGRLLSAAYLAQ